MPRRYYGLTKETETEVDNFRVPDGTQEDDAVNLFNKHVARVLIQERFNEIELDHPHDACAREKLLRHLQGDMFWATVKFMDMVKENLSQFYRSKDFDVGILAQKIASIRTFATIKGVSITKGIINKPCKKKTYLGKVIAYVAKVERKYFDCFPNESQDYKIEYISVEEDKFTAFEQTNPYFVVKNEECC